MLGDGQGSLNPRTFWNSNGHKKVLKSPVGGGQGPSSWAYEQEKGPWMSDHAPFQRVSPAISSIYPPMYDLKS